MNHDASHCLDYDEKKCPKRCYRAQLTEELKHIKYEFNTSWVHFKGTRYCKKWPETTENNK